ncbi:MAG: hypothetical protein ACRDJ3_03640, partial [Solirubrobacteraceae bacterium]
ALLAVRILAEPHGAIEVGAIGMGALVAYWMAYAALWLDPGERLLVRDMGRAIASRLSMA